MTLNVLSAASLRFFCPSGQTVTLVSVSYSSVSITDEDCGATLSLSGGSDINRDARVIR